MRFRIHHNDPSGKLPVATAGNPLVLRVGPYSLDQVDVYESYGGTWHVSHSGAIRNNTIGNCVDDLHCFSLHTDTHEASTIYIRVHSQGLRLIKTEVTLANTLLVTAAPRLAQISGKLALSIAMLMLGLLFFSMQRSQLLHIYCWHQAAVVVLLFDSTGMLRAGLSDIPDEAIQAIRNLIRVARLFTIVLLGRAAIAAYQPPPAYRKLCDFLLVWCAASALLVSVGYAHLGVTLNYLLLPANLLVQLYGTMNTSGCNRALKTIIYACYGFYLAAFTVVTLVAFDLLYFSPLTGILRDVADWQFTGVAIGIFTMLYANHDQTIKKSLLLQEVQDLRFKAMQAEGQREILRERDTLIDVLTHELKTPLGTIRFALASLKRDLGANHHSLQRIKHIDASVQRMDSIVEHVAESVKLEQTYPTGQLESMPAELLLEELISDLRSFARFKLHIDKGATFHTDRHLLTQILNNLLSNAEKYSAPGDILVFVRTAPAHPAPLQANSDANGPPRLIYLEVCNRVAPENAPDTERLFQRYYRHANSMGMPGIGIGLHLVQVAADHIGATVHYRLEDSWAIFEVRIPT